MKMMKDIALLATSLWVINIIIESFIDNIYSISTLESIFTLDIIISSAIVLNLNKHENLH